MQGPAPSFPKRLKVDDDAIATQQIHGDVDFDPRSIPDQWQAAASAASTVNAATVRETTGTGGHTPPRFGFGGCLPAMADPAAFIQSNLFCCKVTQACRTCRSLFESHVNLVAASNPSMSTKKCRRAALVDARRDFGWTKKDLRSRMCIRSGYTETKDAGGWYRVEADAESKQMLRALRPRMEVATDTLHPTWRQLLAIVSEPSEPHFTGRPHDWVVFPCVTSEPVPLRSTYLARDPLFNFEHLGEPIIDVHGCAEDDPSCGKEQSDDPKLNACYCFPSLFGFPSRKGPSPVQVFRTSNGRNNGLQALAVGEFVGLVTRDLQDVDMLSSRGYQIWQGRLSNYTRFVNHSCRGNAQLQSFVWRNIEGIVLVSRGIGARQEVTADYFESYWRGQDKVCRCSESCCRYK
ncbi:hypothetical protein C8A03DRAFT_47624 [Achaetomium macrosporum]|uniref:SET domain-containing protein n=1 Tax=Achaetomium macrosporum TaxID=79813 RepID=A0AAN7C2P7_9PEZI|nr:hypothetical protein C8A03DRAFT_47624 [Achaetomium macrosporum]